MVDGISQSDRQVVRADVVENALDGLVRTVEFVAQAHSQPLAWKWACIAMHNALYGFAIGILGQGNPLPAWNIVTKSKDGQAVANRRWRKWVDKLEEDAGRDLDQYEILVETARAGKEPPILPFMKAVRKAAEGARFEAPASMAQVESHLDSAAKLGAMRNTFVHYPPTVAHVWTAWDFIPVIEGAAKVTSLLVRGSIEGRMLVPFCQREVRHHSEALQEDLQAFGPLPMPRG